MKVIIRLYKELTLRNLSAMVVEVPSAKVTVRELKNKISNIYNISPDYLKLTYQLCNKQIIILTNDFPLFFFNIKEYSTIFLEILNNTKKVIKINIEDKLKYKYYKNLSFFLPDSKTIQLYNSNNIENSYSEEYELIQFDENDDSKNICYSENKQKISYKETLKNNLIKYVKMNDVNNVKNVFENFVNIVSSRRNSNNSPYQLEQENRNRLSNSSNTNYNSNSISFSENNEFNNTIELLDENGWNAIHYACYKGYNELLKIFFYTNVNIKPNINLVSEEGWSPLQLAVLKNRLNCIEILLSIENLDINYVGPQGTALHIACKKNYYEIVKLLLNNNCDIYIKDKNNKVALDYCKNKNLKKLFNKKNSCKKINNTKEIEFLEEINEDFPYKPPIILGEIEQKKIFFNSFKLKLIEINPRDGLIKIFKLVEDYPEMPQQIIYFNDIINCTYIKNMVSIIINGNKEINFMTHFPEISKKYVIIINKCIKYYQFWENIRNSNKKYYSKITNYLSSETFRLLKIFLNKQIQLFDIDGRTQLQLDSELFSENIIINQNSKLSNDDSSSNNSNNNNDCAKNNCDDNKNNNDCNDNNNNNDCNDHNNNNCKDNNNNCNDTNINNCNNTNNNKNNITAETVNLNSFECLKLIGEGSFGKVYKVKHKKSGKIYAMKVLSKSAIIKNKLLKYANMENKILQESNCPFILKLYYSFQTPDNLYLIIDYCSLGDLSYPIDKILFEEDEAKFYIAELVLAIEYLHEKNILYRDLKPENILIFSDGHIKLADFGLAKQINNATENTNTFCGSAKYLSPEMLNEKGATKASDIYGIGVVLYELMNGKPPFYSTNIKSMLFNIQNKKLTFPDYFSDEVKDLLSKLLNKNPSKRLNIQEIKNHEFFNDIDWDELVQKKINPTVDISNFKEESEDEEENEKCDFEDMDYSKENLNIRRIADFSFVREGY